MLPSTTIIILFIILGKKFREFIIDMIVISVIVATASSVLRENIFNFSSKFLNVNLSIDLGGTSLKKLFLVTSSIIVFWGKPLDAIIPFLS